MHSWQRRSVLRSAVLFTLGAALGCAEPTAEVADTGGAPPQLVLTEQKDPMEGELFGRFYSNGSVITSGTAFGVGLDALEPLDIMTTRLQGGFADFQSTGFSSSKAHWGWNDPVANDGACQGINDWTYGNRAASVAGYENGDRWDDVNEVPQYWAVEAHPRGGLIDPEELEMHCIRPGRYLLSAARSGWSGSRVIDYVGIEAGASNYVTVSVGGGEVAQIEAESYSTDDFYRDVRADFDIVAQPSAGNVAPTLAVDGASSYSTATFSAGSGIASAAAGHYLRALADIPSPASPDHYLARLWWGYGTRPNTATGFYSTFVQGHLLRWHQIPSGTPSGCYIVGADAAHRSLAPKSAPQTFVRVGVGTTCASGLDLVIGSVTANATSTSVTPELKITNVSGTSFSGNVTVTLYLSTDQAFGGDTQIGTPSASLNLAAGATQSVNLSSVTLPASGQTVYLFAVLSGASGEGETSNNTMWDPSSFTTPVNLDLLIDSVTGPGTLAQGTSATVPVYVRNAGTGAVPPSMIKVYLSADAVVGAGDVQVGSLNDGSNLSAGASRTENVTVSISPSQATGSYYLIAVVDANNAVSESNEGNNTKVRTGQVTVTAPSVDISTSNPLPQMNPAEPGQEGQIVKFHVLNNGTTTLQAGWSGQVWASLDQTLSGNDILVASWTMFETLAGGASQALYLEGTAPSAGGTYYLITKVDVTGVVTESNESNNVRIGTWPWTVELP